MLRSYLILFFVFLSSLSLTQACSCLIIDYDNPPVQEYNEIFWGKLIKVTPHEIKQESPTFSGFTTRRVGQYLTFEVVKKWKGSSERTLTVYQSTGTCEKDFGSPDLNWIVSTNLTSPTLENPDQAPVMATNICLLNISEKEEEKFAQVLKTLDRMFPQPIKLRSKIDFWWRGIATGSIILLFLLYLQFKRKKRR